jgi:hypothetical protein
MSADTNVTVELADSWRSHYGLDRRTGEPTSEYTRDQDTAELLEAIRRVAVDGGGSVGTEHASHQLPVRHFDGGITTDHLELVKAAFASTAAAITFFRAAKPTVMKWLGKGHSLTLRGPGIDIKIKKPEDIDQAIRLLQAAKGPSRSKRAKKH